MSKAAKESFEKGIRVCFFIQVKAKLEPKLWEDFMEVIVSHKTFLLCSFNVDKKNHTFSNTNGNSLFPIVIMENI